MNFFTNIRCKVSDNKIVKIKNINNKNKMRLFTAVSCG
jgi:hypothetical protein